MKRKILTFFFGFTAFIMLYSGSIFSGIPHSACDAASREYKKSTGDKRTEVKKGQELKAKKLLSPSIVSTSRLPSGTVGEEYSYQIRSSERSSLTTFSVDKQSAMPPGLHLKTNGYISGIPTTPGSYTFSVILKNVKKVVIEEKKYTLAVRKKSHIGIHVTPQPATIYVVGKKASSHDITYYFSAPRVKKLEKSTKSIKPSTIGIQKKSSERAFVSREGIFEKEGKRFKNVKSPVKVVLKNNTGKLSETLNVPASISKEVTQKRAGQIIYKRIFMSDDRSTKLISEIILQKSEGKVKKKDKKLSYVKGQIVIVTQDSKAGRNLPERLGKKYKLDIVESFTVKSLNKRVTVFKTKEKILKLIQIIKREKGVIQVQTNNIFGTMTEPKSDMQSIAKELNFSKLHKHYRGKGVVVAVIDTGVDTKHEDLKDRVMLSKNFLRGSSYKAEIHGTAVAGIIAASINGFGIEGIAPEVKLMALRACRQISDEHPEGRGDTFSILKALDVAIEKKARIVNMSFGSYAPDRLIREVLREGARRRILFVAPVGNVSGLEGPTFPASCPYVIAVGGLDGKGNYYPDKTLASRAKVCAPAVNIFTTVPGNSHNFLNGTSISTAVVSGILAVVIEKNGMVRESQLPEFKNNICQWAEKILQLSICKK